jgi:hypothetical protein
MVAHPEPAAAKVNVMDNNPVGPIISEVTL